MKRKMFRSAKAPWHARREGLQGIAAVTFRCTDGKYCEDMPLTGTDGWQHPQQ